MSAGTRVQVAIARLGRWTGRADVRRALLGPAAHDLSPTDDAWVLRVLAAAAPLRASALDEMQVIDRSTVTAQGQRRERAGLIAREPDPRDGRAALLTLTDRGLRVRQAIDAAGGAVLDQLMSDWSADDRATLAALRDRLTLSLPGAVPGSDVATELDGNARTVSQ